MNSGRSLVNVVICGGQVAKVLQTEETQARLKADGLAPGGGPPEQLRAIIKSDVK